MACRNDLEIDKVLIWNTRIPFENEPRSSPVFSFMGSDWCLRFVYRDGGLYHVINLHQMSDGKILEKVKDLQTPFRVTTYMMKVTEPDNIDTLIDVMNVTVIKTSQYIWISDDERKRIFESLPWLYDRPDIKFACRFYGHPPSTFQLQIETVHLSPAVCEKSTEDKGVQVSPEVPRDVAVQVSSEVLRDIESLSSDLSRLLEKEVLPDARLECGGRTFRAHRSILGARSEVFRAMFQNGMLEGETGTVKIHDVDVGVLEKLLKFLYSGKPDDLSEGGTADLYEAADKYAVSSLKTACAYWVERNLTAENCLKYLEVADTHSDSDLKAAVVSFIVENPRVFKSEACLVLSRELPVLATEVLQTYVAATVP